MRRVLILAMTVTACGGSEVRPAEHATEEALATEPRRERPIFYVNTPRSCGHSKAGYVCYETAEQCSQFAAPCDEKPLFSCFAYTLAMTGDRQLACYTTITDCEDAREVDIPDMTKVGAECAVFRVRR